MGITLAFATILNKTCSEKRKSPSATLYTLLQDTAHQLLIMSKTYTTADVAQHKDESNGYWLIVENDVYDVSSKSALHCSFPGCAFSWPQGFLLMEALVTAAGETTIRH